MRAALLFSAVLAGCASTQVPRKELGPAELNNPIVMRVYEQHEREDKRMWACVWADIGTTGVGLVLGLAESNPIGLAVIPLSLWGAHVAQKTDTAKNAVARVHCAAGAWNVGMIATAL
jgi:hypothetical protein